MDVILLSSCVPNAGKNSMMRPRGCYQIAWYLRKHDYSVQVLEYVFRLSDSEINDLIDKFVTKDTRIIGLGAMILMDPTSMGAMIKKFERVLLEAKKRYPWVKIICGGPSSPFWSRIHRNRTLFDYVFTGHAEDPVLALCNHLFKAAPHPQFEIADGNKFIREKFKMPHDTLYDIESADHLWDDRDCIQPGEALPLELSRGCVFKCKFCRFPHIGKSKNDFSRSMECVKTEIIDNYNRWGVYAYYMLDDTFNADQDRMREFYEMTQTLPFKIEYATYLRPDLLAAHPDTQFQLLESGLRGAYLGIETFNKEAATLIGKPWNGTKAKDYLPKLHEDIWKKRVNFHVGMICGIPPESFNEASESNQYLIDTGMPGCLWFPLNINRDAHDEFKSDFDINSDNYGFEWTVKDGRPMWKTPYCDRIAAGEWQVKLMEQYKPHQHFCSWNLIEMVSYGYDTQDLIEVRMIDFFGKSLEERRINFLKGYLEDLKKYYV